MAMNPEIKAKWLEALRSGKYQQTTGVLRRGDSYCCLGVLCDLSVEGSWSTLPEGDCYLFVTTKEGKPNCSVLPDAVATETKLPLTEQGRLASMNDRGKSFEQIANWIEHNL